MHASILEVSRSALKNNIDYIKSKVAENCRISSVVKGNAYGHGIECYVPMAQKLGINHFSVFSAAEAYRVAPLIRKRTDLMIMGMIGDDEIPWAIENGIEFWVFDMGRLDVAIESAKRLNKKAKIHLEVETGMNRTGIENGEIKRAINYFLNNNQHLILQGLCTHYAGAENLANSFRVSQQIATYKKQVKRFEKAGLSPKYRHTSCSAATVNYPKTQFDLVRIGILMYGFWPSPETFIIRERKNNPNVIDPLKRVISWKTRIMSIKHVKTGEYIGYGTSYLAHKDMIVASIPIGYAHGFSRSLSNVGRAIVRGERVGVVGIVNMNMTLLDVSELPNIERNEEVVLIGTQGERSMSVSSFSEFSNQLNYESLTRIAEDIPRVAVKA